MNYSLVINNNHFHIGKLADYHLFWLDLTHITKLHDYLTILIRKYRSKYVSSHIRYIDETFYMIDNTRIGIDKLLPMMKCSKRLPIFLSFTIVANILSKAVEFGATIYAYTDKSNNRISLGELISVCYSSYMEHICTNQCMYCMTNINNIYGTHLQDPFIICDEEFG